MQAVEISKEKGHATANFELLEAIHSGDEPLGLLLEAKLDVSASLLFIARELQFLSEVAGACGVKMTAQILDDLHVELLKKATKPSEFPL